MNNSKTPKIVIGVGLAAVYASGLAILTLRGAHDEVVPQAVTDTPPAQVAGEYAPPAAIVPPSGDVPTTDATVTEASTGVAEQTAAKTTAPAPVAGTAAKSLGAPAPRIESIETRVRGKEQLMASVASASPAQRTAVEESSPASEGAGSGSIPADSAGAATSSMQAGSASSANDSQITADVKSQMAAIAVAGNIEVTTKDGVVELTGSVPSQEDVDRARLAARNVADVRDVDASALMVGN